MTERVLRIDFVAYTQGAGLGSKKTTDREQAREKGRVSKKAILFCLR
jgi:hypothetical protein